MVVRKPTTPKTEKGAERPSPVMLRHRPFYIAAIAGLVAGGAALVLERPVAIEQSMGIEIGAIAFFLAYLALTFFQLPHLSAGFLKAHAEDSDAPVGLIFVVTVAAVVVSAASLFILINTDRTSDPLRAVHLILGMLSVVLSWFAIHTMAGLHYAYEYYRRPEVNPAGKAKSAVTGGLDFPGNDEPDGGSFLYFSYVIGMTAQVSDVCVESNAMRKLVTVHSVFSFFFNTVIVAATVNIVVSLGS